MRRAVVTDGRRERRPPVPSDDHRCRRMHHQPLCCAAQMQGLGDPRSTTSGDQRSVAPERAMCGSSSHGRLVTSTNRDSVHGDRWLGGCQPWSAQRVAATSNVVGNSAVTTCSRHSGHMWQLIPSQTMSAATDPSSPSISVGQFTVPSGPRVGQSHRSGDGSTIASLSANGQKRKSHRSGVSRQRHATRSEVKPSGSHGTWLTSRQGIDRCEMGLVVLSVNDTDPTIDWTSLRHLTERPRDRCPSGSTYR